MTIEVIVIASKIGSAGFSVNHSRMSSPKSAYIVRIVVTSENVGLAAMGRHNRINSCRTLKLKDSI
jgi:hypothetical protein